MRWIKKMDDTFLMRTTSSITMQSLAKIVLRAPAVGAKMWCLFLVCSLSGALCCRGVHSRAFRFAIRIDSPIHFKRIDSNRFVL